MAKKTKPSFLLQAGFSNLELACVMTSSNREDYKMGDQGDALEGRMPVGSVEFCESFLPQTPAPIYYPAFLKDFFFRKIWHSDILPNETCFLKPADRHKRFKGYLLEKDHIPYLNTESEAVRGPFYCSEPIKFLDEWRYYVADGEVLGAYWYDGDEYETKPPKLDIKWPKTFCGAVDFGRTSFGEVALVKNNLPYGCDWYGGYSNAGEYKEWLEKGWSFMMKNYA